MTEPFQTIYSNKILLSAVRPDLIFLISLILKTIFLTELIKVCRQEAVIRYAELIDVMYVCNGLLYFT